MMGIQAIDPHTDTRWLTFVEQHPDALIFHHPLWMRVLEETYGYGQVSLACVEEGQLLGVIPLLEVKSRFTGRRAVSLPFSDCSAILVTHPLAAAALCARLLELQGSRGWRYVEIRGGVPDVAIPSASYKAHRIRLQPDSDKVFRTFDKGRTQSTIRRCERTGVLIQRRSDAAAIETFVRLNYVTRRKHGLPPQPDSFFESLHRLLIVRGFGFVNVAVYKGTAVAASVFLHYNGVVYHKFNASDEGFLHLRPNHGILWDAIRWACEQGFSAVDLGRSDLAGEGLIKFKRGWGAAENDLYYYRFPACTGGRPASSTLDALKPLFQRMPIPLLKAVGRVLYAHVG